MSVTGIPDYYHISDRINEHKDADDKKGSQSYPSRTFWGQQWEIAQRFPWLMEPLRIFGIPISSPGYYMNDGLTIAQVELMAMDVSVTDYGESSSKGTKEDPLEKLNTMSEADSESVVSAAEKWNEKYGNGQKVTLDLSAYGIEPMQEKYTLEELKKISETNKEQ